MKFLLIALIVVVCGCGQKESLDAKSDPSSKTSEVKESVDDVVGTYKFGSNLGVWGTLELRDDSTFVFSYNGALGRHGGDEGTFERSGETVVLNPEMPFNYGGYLRQATVLYPVTWADRLYLIGDHQILRFCNRVLEGWSGDQYGGSGDYYYLRVDGEPTEEVQLLRVQSTPDVPQEFERFLEEEFTCRVLNALSSRTVLIDKGSADGVAVGSKLHTTGAGWLIVTTVKEHESECEVGQLNGAVPNVGTEYSPRD